MNIQRIKVLFVPAAVAITALSLLTGNDVVLRILAAIAFLAGALMKRGTDDNTLITLATGELLTIAVAASSFIAGFLVQCAVTGSVLFGGRAPTGERDAVCFVVFCLLALLGAIVLDRSNQPLAPFLAMVTIVVISTLALTGIEELRERRKYAEGGT